MRPVSIIRVNMTRIKIKIIDLFVMLKKSFLKKALWSVKEYRFYEIEKFFKSCYSAKTF